MMLGLINKTNGFFSRIYMCKMKKKITCRRKKHNSNDIVYVAYLGGIQLSVHFLAYFDRKIGETFTVHSIVGG